MTGKVTVLAPGQPNPPAKVHGGFGRTKRNLNSMGALFSEAARLYKKANAGDILPEDLTKMLYSLTQMRQMREAADLEKVIDRLERQLAELAEELAAVDMLRAENSDLRRQITEMEAMR